MRASKLYRNMTPYMACAYAEGFCEGEGASEEDILIAWQWIYDHDLWKELQGYYGRTIFNHLLPNNLISGRS